MITVAKSFDAPIKLLFPQDLIENGLLAANKFAMLGLGSFSSSERSPPHSLFF
jgi:minor histocompatibility antigen H13